MSIIIPLIIGALSIIVPGFLLSLALLKKTGLHLFEIAVIGFIFGLIFPPTLVWLESYLIPVSPIFSFSNSLYNADVVILTIIGIVLCVQQGAFEGTHLNFMAKTNLGVKKEIERDYKKRIASLRSAISELNTDIKLIKDHENEELELQRKHEDELDMLAAAGAEEKQKITELHRDQERRLFEQHEAEEKKLLNSGGVAKLSEQPQSNIIWIALIVIMLLTFASRMLSISNAPAYFEFDPYFDMISTQYILTYGHQLLYDHAAWPSLVNGTFHRIQPLVPYLEAYWYNLAGANPASTTINTTQLSFVSSWYPPITAALLVFAVFMFLYHEYGEYPAIIGAGLAASMPVLITTFIAGEQLLEPWGIFALFFFYAAYILAVNNPKEKRYAILAGIAFASNFLGAHYFTVPAAVLSAYIVVQGLINIFKSSDNRDFYIMNMVMLAVIVLFYIPYGAYDATLAQVTPSIFGIPVIVSFPILALVLVAFIEYPPKLAKDRRMIPKLDNMTYLIWSAAVVIIAILSILFTPLGHPFQKYIALSEHYTTPSSPLFMTVQEYAPTGFLTYDFGPGGFGIIGDSIGGISIIVWAVLILFSALSILAAINRNSKSSVLALAAVWPLTIAGMIEVKYLPHFGVAYILAICVIIGELSIYYSKDWSETAKKAIAVAGVVILIAEAAPVAYQLLTAASNPNCSTIANQSNALGSVLYCNTVPNYWLAATAWMRTNVGPYGPRILSWWDYGDWINWFGNSNAVLRGDNSVPMADYQAAAHYVFNAKDGFNNSEISSYMDSVQAKYILFDDQLVPKWGALDFLACTYVNQTGLQFALQAGKAQGQPFALGTSNCEINHDPVYLLVPIPTSSGTLGVNTYCSFPGNSTTVALRGVPILGASALNTSYCIPESFLQTGNPTYLLNANGSKTNAIISTAFYGGATTISGQEFVSFLLLYAPNGPNDTVTNAPSEFYNSTYYRGFFLGRLGKGFKLVYPNNFTGINYVNSTHQIMIYSLENFSGTLPTVTKKPAYVKNNYTIPG